MAWLGQKSDLEPVRPMPTAPPVSPQMATHPIPRETFETVQPAPVASIGKSLHVKGELSGNEDLLIEGKVEGSITLNGYKVTIGPTGHVTAGVKAKSVVVGGRVDGSITADERVEVAATGTMVGDIRAPRIVLIDGARFKGRIEMDSTSAPGVSAAAPAASRVMGSPTLSHEETREYASATKS